jgi:guanine nucleotide-binding protein G(i) subunit alpha
MGCGMSTEEKEGKARNEEIENQLKRDKMMQRNEIKMLLLGMLANPAAAVASQRCTAGLNSHCRWGD